MIEVNLSIALLAGMLATMNPCGFAMLPAYLGALVMGQGESEQSNFLGAIRFSTGMGLGLVGVFGMVGLLLAPARSAVEPILPLVTLGMGALLIIAGVSSLAGRGFGIRWLMRGGVAPGSSLISQIGYGATFALASLSCTIGPFLAATTTALRTGSAIDIIFTVLAYGFGMALTVLILALLTVGSGGALLKKLRSKTRTWEKALGVILILVGLYLLNYAWYELALIAGNSTVNPVVDFALAIQSHIARTMLQIGPQWLLAIALLLALSTLAGIWRNRRRLRDQS